MTDAKQEMIYKDFVKHCFFMVLTWYPAQTNTANPQETFTGWVGDSLPGWKTYLCIQTADRAPFTSRWRKEQWYQIINNEQIIMIKHSVTQIQSSEAHFDLDFGTSQRYSQCYYPLASVFLPLGNHCKMAYGKIRIMICLSLVVKS